MASTDINKGEEILIKYFDIETASLSRNERRLKLLHWGFSCSCNICSLEESEREKNDNTLQEFREAKTRLQRCLTDPFNLDSLKVQMKIERQIIDILKKLKNQLIGNFASSGKVR